jgi:hypothetical protein
MPASTVLERTRVNTARAAVERMMMEPRNCGGRNHQEYSYRFGGVEELYLQSDSQPSVTVDAGVVCLLCRSQTI